MIKICSRLVLLWGVLFNISSAYSLEWYVGIGAGTSSYDLPDVFNELEGLTNELNTIPGIEASFNAEDSDTAVKVFGGFNINSYLGFEFGYVDLGEVTADFSLVSDGSSFPPGTAFVSSVDSVDGFNGGVVASLPFSDMVSLNGRAGVYLWEAEGKFDAQDTTGFFLNESSSESDDGNDLYYGVGLDISWFGLFYEIYDIDGEDVDFAGVSASFGLN